MVMTSLFRGRTSIDSQRPQSRKSIKSRLSFSAQSRELLPDTISTTGKDQEDIPPIPAIPRASTDVKPTVVEVPVEKSREPLVSSESFMAEIAREEPIAPKISTQDPFKLTPMPTNSRPSKDEPRKSLSRENRHSRHDSAMQATPSNPPKRSSSFRGSVLNTYYKIFGGSPKKAPRGEKLPEEAERLRRLTKKYEAQLEEASNILLLQDKVIARWEKDAAKRGVKVTQVGHEELSGFKEVHNENGATDVVPLDKELAPETRSVSGSARSLGLIRESSKEMLSEMAAKQEMPTAEAVEDSSTIRAVDTGASKIEELESAKQNLANALADAEAAKANLMSELESAKAELETTKRAHEEAVSSRNIEPVAVDTSVFDAERATFQSRISELEAQISKLASEHEEHKATLTKELDDVRNAQIASSSEVALLTTSLAESKQAHADAIAQHETTRAALAEQLESTATLHKALSERDVEHASALEEHEKSLADSQYQLEEASSRLRALTADHETLVAKHAESVAALEAAQTQASQLAETQSGEHAAALAALTKEHEDAKNQVRDLAAETEALKKEHADALAALRTQIDAHKAELEQATAGSKAHEDRAASLDEELVALKASHRDLETAHTASTAEINNHINDKNELEAKVAALTTASSGHDAQIADLERVNKELAELQQVNEGHISAKAELEAKIAALEEAAVNHAAVQSDLGTSRARVLELQDAAGSHTTALSELQTQIAALEADVAAHGTNKSALEAKIAALEEQAGQHATNHADLEASKARIIELEEAAGTHASSTAELEAEIAALKADAASHGTSKSELEAKIVELETAASGHSTAKEELKAKIASLKADVATHGANKSDLEAKIAELEAAANDHSATKDELETKIATLTADSESQNSTKEELEAKIAVLTADSDKHATTLAELEATKARGLDLESQIEQHAKTKSELEAAQAHITELKAISDAHDAQKVELEQARSTIGSLSKDIEAHQLVKDDLTSAQGRIADLEKALENGKADHGAVAAKLAAVETSLATAKAEHDKLTVSLAEKEEALQKSVALHEAVQKELEGKTTALATAQEALEKAQVQAASAGTVAVDLKTAKDKAAALESELIATKEKHDLETASLLAKVKDIWKLREQNEMLQKEIEAAHESEKKAKASASKLEADLRAASEPASATKSRGITDQDEEKNSSVLGKAAIAAGALGAAAAGAFGVSKLVGHDEDEEKKSEERTVVESSQQGDDVPEHDGAPGTVAREIEPVPVESEKHATEPDTLESSTVEPESNLETSSHTPGDTESMLIEGKENLHTPQTEVKEESSDATHLDAGAGTGTIQALPEVVRPAGDGSSDDIEEPTPATTEAAHSEQISEAILPEETKAVDVTAEEGSAEIEPAMAASEAAESMPHTLEATNVNKDIVEDGSTTTHTVPLEVPAATTNDVIIDDTVLGSEQAPLETSRAVDIDANANTHPQHGEEEHETVHEVQDEDVSSSGANMSGETPHDISAKTESEGKDIPQAEMMEAASEPIQHEGNHVHEPESLPQEVASTSEQPTAAGVEHAIDDTAPNETLPLEASKAIEADTNVGDHEVDSEMPDPIQVNSAAVESLDDAPVDHNIETIAGSAIALDKEATSQPAEHEVENILVPDTTLEKEASMSEQPPAVENNEQPPAVDNNEQHQVIDEDGTVAEPDPKVSTGEAGEKMESVEPESVELKSVEPENVEPEKVEPENIEPESLKPESVELESVKPESVEPESVKPESVEPETVEPDAVEPETVEPETVEPEAVEPKNIEPETVEPKSIEPESVEPEAVEPETVEPKSVDPESVEPETIEPETVEPKSVEPEAIELNGVKAEAVEPDMVEHATEATSSPKIKCLTCGSDVEVDALAQHFCTPTTSSESLTESSGNSSDDGSREAETMAVVTDADEDAKTDEDAFVTPFEETKQLGDHVDEHEELPPAADLSPEVAAAKEVSIDKPHEDVDAGEIGSTDATNTALGEEAHVTALESAAPEAAELMGKSSSVQAVDNETAAALTTPDFEPGAVKPQEGTEEITDAPAASIEEPAEHSTDLVASTEDAPGAAKNIQESTQPEEHANEAITTPQDAHVMSEVVQSSPTTPSTPSRKKSVRWEDIESSKPTTPIEEGADGPVLNGDHTTADKHSIGPGSPAEELHGLNIADVPLSAEPDEDLREASKDVLVPGLEHDVPLVGEIGDSEKPDVEDVKRDVKDSVEEDLKPDAKDTEDDSRPGAQDDVKDHAKGDVQHDMIHDPKSAIRDDADVSAPEPSDAAPSEAVVPVPAIPDADLQSAVASESIEAPHDEDLGLLEEETQNQVEAEQVSKQSGDGQSPSEVRSQPEDVKEVSDDLKSAVLSHERELNESALDVGSDDKSDQIIGHDIADKSDVETNQHVDGSKDNAKADANQLVKSGGDLQPSLVDGSQVEEKEAQISASHDSKDSEDQLLPSDDSAAQPLEDQQALAEHEDDKIKVKDQTNGDDEVVESAVMTGERVLNEDEDDAAADDGAETTNGEDAEAELEPETPTTSEPQTPTTEGGPSKSKSKKKKGKKGKK